MNPINCSLSRPRPLCEQVGTKQHKGRGEDLQLYFDSVDVLKVGLHTSCRELTTLSPLFTASECISAPPPSLPSSFPLTSSSFSVCMVVLAGFWILTSLLQTGNTNTTAARTQCVFLKKCVLTSFSFCFVFFVFNPTPSFGPPAEWHQ